MKKTAKILSLLACIAFIVGAFATVCFAKTQSTDGKVTVRIEGATSNIFYGEVTLTGESENTIKSVLLDIDRLNGDISFVGIDTNYITAVNGETAGSTEIGYDGWMVRLNGMATVSGIQECNVKSGDEIILYYSDEFVNGMQYPILDTGRLSENVLRFTSDDTTYDSDGNAQTITNPVVGMKVMWGYGDGKVATYTTDEDGCVTIDAGQMTDGEHTLAVERANDGIPTILRFAPDHKVIIGNSDHTDSIQSEDSAKGCKGEMILVLPAVCSVGIALICKRKKRYNV